MLGTQKLWTSDLLRRETGILLKIINVNGGYKLASYQQIIIKQGDGY